VRTASIIIALMMEEVLTSETSVNLNVTARRYIPEDSKLHTRRRENLNSRRRVGWQVDKSVSEKHTASIFSAGRTTHACVGRYVVDG
jgi:glutamate/tyrosine decarboxylase-like PLP-dependent enzyme